MQARQTLYKAPYFFFAFHFETILVSCLVLSWTYYMAQVDLNLAILLPLFPWVTWIMSCTNWPSINLLFSSFYGYASSTWLFHQLPPVWRLWLLLSISFYIMQNVPSPLFYICLSRSSADTCYWLSIYKLQESLLPRVSQMRERGFTITHLAIIILL